jgi:hypothetical protein
MKKTAWLVAIALVAAVFVVTAAPTPEHLANWPIATAVALSTTVPCTFTIREFCEAHKISQAFYYIMKNEGWGPAEMRAGHRVLISYEAAADWRRTREAAAAAGVRRAVANNSDAA